LTEVLRFQYVQCQFEILQKLSSENEIHNALQRLPKGLDATYDRIFESIDPDFRERVIHTLKWLAFSMRTLYLNDLCDIFIIRPSGDITVNKNDRLFSPEYISEYLSSLIVVHKRRGSHITNTEVRLVHFSLKEYFISTRIVESTPAFAFTEADAHLSIVHSCLAYFTQFSPPEMAKIRKYERFGLKQYVPKYWMTHLEEVPRQRWPARMAHDVALMLGFHSQSFLDQLWMEGKLNKQRICGYIRLPSCCYTARLGLYQLTQLLICQEPYTTYKTQEDLDVALQHAVYGENIEVMKLFLEIGADANAECGEWGSALFTAAEKGNLSALELLVKSGANMNSASERGMCPLTGFGEKSIQCLDFLLDNGADIDMRGGGDVTALTHLLSFLSVDWGWFKLLLGRKANVNAIGGRFNTPLQAACASVDLYALQDYVEALLEGGADPNIQGGEYGTALQALCGRLEVDVHTERAIPVIQLLIDHGADVNSHGGKYGSVFNAAASCVSSSTAIQIMKLLYNRGAEIDQQGGDTEWGTALHVACNKGSVEAVRWLLDKGVDANAESGRFATPLQAAVAGADRGRMQTVLEMIKMLMEKDARVNQQGGEYGTALQAAYASRDAGKDLRRLLLQHGADINIKGGKYGSVLAAACGNNGVRARGVRLLLDRGADVNADGGEYGTALIAACTRRPEDAAEVVRLLLEHGADVNAQGGEYETALAAACKQSASPELVSLLLDRGADPRRQNCLAWHMAARHADVPILKLLLGHIDINHVHAEYGTALNAVIESWQLGRYYPAQSPYEKALFLLESGADADMTAGNMKFAFALQAACVAEYQLDSVYDGDIDYACTKTKLLLEQRPDINVNAQGGMYNTALQAAAYSGQTASISLLLDKKVDCNLRGGKYGSALNAAIISGYWDIVEVLLKAGAAPDCRLQQEPDEEWLQRVREEDGRGAYERYMKFWEVQSASGGTST
jgi:ankyrin repeat protein